MFSKICLKLSLKKDSKNVFKTSYCLMQVNSIVECSSGAICNTFYLHTATTCFYWPFQGLTSFVDHFRYLCLVFVMLSRLFIAALWSPAGKGLTFWLLFCDV